MKSRVCTSISGLLLSLCFGQHAFGQCSEVAKMSDYDRKMFIAAAYGQKAEVSAEFLSLEGCSKQMTTGLAGLGAKLLYSDERVGYALVSLPKDKLFAALDLWGIAYGTVDRIREQEGFIPLQDRKIIPVPPFTIPFPRVANTLPLDGPYFANPESGVTALWKEHPNADGRGVRVGVADVGFDLLHPELQKGRDAHGKLVPKIADFDPLSTPETDDSWVEFDGPIKSKDGLIQAVGRDWHVPGDGEYRFGIYDHKVRLGSEADAKEHRVTKIELSAGVLWSETKGLVWVDTDGDGDFRNDLPLADYAVHHQIAWFGTQDREDDNRIPFGVKIDTSRKAAFLSIGGDHGALIAGPLAGNTWTGGLFDGTAPAAQLVDVRDGGAKIPMLLRAFARNDVDIVNRSGGVARDTAREEFERHVLERALSVYKKPFVCYCDLGNALFILDYQSPEMLRRNRQIGPPYQEAINARVSLIGDGLVNLVLAPSTSLVAQSRYLGSTDWADGKRHVGTEEYDALAPDGYAIGSNPSPTSVVASGVLADLISEARRDHVRYDSARLTNAIFTSAKQVAGFPAAYQGYGLIDAAGAWDQLVRMGEADDPSNPTLTSFKVVSQEGVQREEVYGFHQDFEKAEESVSGALLIERVGGYEGARAYRLALRADDGTYTLEDTKANFVRGVPTRVRFRTTVRSGMHVAFVQLVDEKTASLMQEIPLSVRAPEIPETLGPGVEKYQATIPPLHSKVSYIHLDDNVQAARFNMRIPYAGPPSFVSTCSFPGYRCRGTKPPAGDPVDASHHVGPMMEMGSLVANTDPGTKEIFWENYGRPDYGTSYYGPAPDVPITGTIVVTKYAVALAKQGQETLLAINKLADIEGKVELFDAKLTSSQVGSQEAHGLVDVQRNVPPHLSQWRVAVSSASLPPDSADAFLLNCTDGKDDCYVAAQRSVGKGGATLVIDNPKEGNWRIIIRTREPVDRPAQYHVREAFLTPATTRLESVDENHATGATWSVVLPPKRDDAQYVAFQIAGTPGPEGTQNEGAKYGIRIALTPLDSNAP